MSRSLIVGVLAVIAAGFLVWLLASDPLAAPGGEASRESVPPLAVEPELAAPLGEAEPRRTQVAEPVSSPSERTAPGEAEVELSGTFVVVDHRGVEHTRESGHFSLILWKGNSGDHAKVKIEDGSWHATVARPDRVSVHTAVLGGKAVISQEEQSLPEGPLPSDYAIVFQGTWVATLTLRVIGDDTGADLSGVEIAAVDDWRRDSFRHPGDRGDHRRLVEGGRSPVQFEPRKAGQSRTFWVCAAGYAWDKIKLSLTDPDERVIRLVPGGGLLVAIHGGDLPRDAVLRLRSRTDADRPDGIPNHVWDGLRDQRTLKGMPVAEVALRESAATPIEGLPAGRYWVQVEKGDWFQDPVELGRAEATVGAGQMSQVTVTLADQPKAPTAVRVSGTLRLPKAWSRDHVRLEIEPTGDLKVWVKDDKKIALDDMTQASTEEYAWDAGLLPAGDYQVLVAPHEVRRRFHVGAQGAADVRIEVPPPAEVRVRIVDALTGLAIPDVKPGWYSTVKGWEGGWSHAPMRAAANGSFEFEAAPGEIEISAQTEGYGWMRASREVRPGLNDFVVEARRVCGVVVVLLDGDTELPWDEAWSVKLKTSDGESAVDFWSGAKVAAKQPGAHALSVTGVKGYADIEERPVTVAPGEWTRVEIRLERK